MSVWWPIDYDCELSVHIRAWIINSTPIRACISGFDIRDGDLGSVGIWKFCYCEAGISVWSKGFVSGGNDRVPIVWAAGVSA